MRRKHFIHQEPIITNHEVFLKKNLQDATLCLKRLVFFRKVTPGFNPPSLFSQRKAGRAVCKGYVIQGGGDGLALCVYFATDGLQLLLPLLPPPLMTTTKAMSS